MGGGEAMLAGDVDEGLPLRVGEVYASLALCCRNQVTHATIVLGARPRPCLRAGTDQGYRPHSGEKAARDHGPEEPAWVIYSPQAKGFRKEERAPCARIKASRRWPTKSSCARPRLGRTGVGSPSKKRWKPFWTPRPASNLGNSGTVPTAKRASKRRR